MKKRRFKHIGEYILTFVLTFFVFLVSVLALTQCTLMSPKFMKLQIQRANYVHYVAKEANQNITSLGLGSGIQKSVMKGVPSETAVRQDLNLFVDRAYSGAGITLQAKQVRRELNQKVAAYAKQRGLKQTQTAKTAINQFVNQAIHNYSQSIQVPYLIQIGSNVKRIKKYLIASLVIGMLIVLAIAFSLFKLLHFHHRLWRYLGYIFCSNSLMLIVAPFILIYSKIINRLAIKTQGLYRLVTNYLQAITWSFVIAGLISLVIGIGFILASELRRKKRVGMS